MLYLYSQPKTIELWNAVVQSAKTHSSLECSSRDRQSSDQRHQVYFFRLTFRHSKSESLHDVSVTRISDTLSYSFPQTV